MVNNMSRTVKHLYEHCKYIMKQFYTKQSTRNSSSALKHFTKRYNRARTRTNLQKLIINPEYADKVIFNKYYKQEEPWKWF